MLLMIDNYDSFTYNLVQYFLELGDEVEVIRNDKLTLDDIEQLAPRRLVISPGPCTPKEAGISVAAIRRFTGQIPIIRKVEETRTALVDYFKYTNACRADNVKAGTPASMSVTEISDLLAEAVAERLGQMEMKTIVLKPF